VTDYPGDAFAAALDALKATQAQAPPAAPAPDLGLTAGVPVPPPPPAPTDADIKLATDRTRLLDGTDTTTGAPVMLRALVGAAKGDADRLATIRSYYPDAEPLPGSDNFVYTDPGTGKRQTYAPMGLRVPTVGDVASVGREIAQGVGGTAGAALASPSGPIGVAAGGGLGAAAGDQAYQGLMRFLGMADTRTPVQQGVDVATTGGVNAVMPVVGEKILGPLIDTFRPSAFIDAMRPNAAPTATATAAKSLDDSGLTGDLLGKLPAGVAAESTPAQRVEQAINQLPVTGGVRTGYVDTSKALEDATQTAAQRAAGGGNVPSPQTFGGNVSGIAKTIDEQWQRDRLDADNFATSQVGANTQVNLDSARSLLAQMQREQSAAPQSLAGRYQPAIAQLQRLLSDADANGGTLGFDTVRNIRSDLGQAIDWGPNAIANPDPPLGTDNLKRVYGTLKDSLLDTADAQGPQAYAALQDHDAMVSRYNAPGGPAETLRELQNPDARSDKLLRMTQSTAPGDAASLGQVVTYATPAQRQQISAGVLNQMGVKADGTFDMGTWMRNYAKTTDAAKTMLFGPQDTGLQADLDNLATVQKTMSQSAANKNFSNTAGVLVIMNALAAAGGDLATGHLGAAATALGSNLVGPPLVGAMMSSRPFVRWLSGAGAVNPQNGAAWGEYLGRLAGVAQADPSIANQVAALRQQLQPSTGGGGPDLSHLTNRPVGSALGDWLHGRAPPTP
jgi:hypothetical protein